MTRTVFILLISLLLSGAIQSCNNGGFKQTRAEMLERQEQRKIEYKAKKEVEEAEKIRIEAEALAEARVKAEQRAVLEKDPVQGPEFAPVEPLRYMEDTLLFQFERQPCFGRCPVYKIKIYESGLTLYEGINFVDQIGYYQTRLSSSEIARIYTLLAEAQFFELEDKYDNEKIMDLPSMSFRARAMGKDKRIFARYQIPEELQILASAIDDLFAETEWQASAPQ